MMLGASSEPLGVTTNTSGRCRSATWSTSWPSRQGREPSCCTHGCSLVIPSARSPITPITPIAASTASSTAAPMAEPVTMSSTAQQATMPPATAQRLRLRGATGGRRPASLLLVIAPS